VRESGKLVGKVSKEGVGQRTKGEVRTSALHQRVVGGVNQPREDG